MKKMFIVSAIATIAAFSSFEASAQPLPGGNPNCSANWVGGACGPISNNGYQPSFCESAKNANDERCKACGRDKEKA